jgi:hypothetical protein
MKNESWLEHAWEGVTTSFFGSSIWEFDFLASTGNRTLGGVHHHGQALSSKTCCLLLRLQSCGDWWRTETPSSTCMACRAGLLVLASQANIEDVSARPSRFQLRFKQQPKHGTRTAVLVVTIDSVVFFWFIQSNYMDGLWSKPIWCSLWLCIFPVQPVVHSGLNSYDRSCS